MGILEQASEAVHGPRQEYYGHPADNHGCTAALWSAWLSRRLRTTIAITPADVCFLNILQKLSREANVHHTDNLVDLVGYTLNVELIDQRVGAD